MESVATAVRAVATNLPANSVIMDFRVPMRWEPSESSDTGCGFGPKS